MVMGSKSDDWGRWEIISWLVSILICTYNAAETIEKTIQSCLNQSYQHIEILIHDDQSKDATLQIISNIQNNKIKIIKSGKKLGPYWWLNFLLDHVQWEFVAIQDHDDLWHKEKLLKQIEFLHTYPTYIGCGTKTLMWYEWDQKWFEYYLGEKNYYTIHPALVFRSGEYKYPIDTNYMVDAYFQKKILCHWEKIIWNINETLTLHLVKAGAENYSYKWFSYSMATLRSIFYLHPVRYGVCILWWETLRKILYPLFHRLWKWTWIDKMERFPFVLLGNRVGEYGEERRREMGV